MRKLIGASESSSIFMLGVCFSSIIAIILSYALINVNVSFDGMTLVNWLGYPLIQLAFVGVVLIYSKIRKVDIISVARVRKPASVRQLILIPFIAIATILVFLPLANAWVSFLDVIGFKGSGASMPNYSNAGVYFLSLLLMAVIPALGEELFIRGSVFSGLSTRSTWFSILISALFFSLMHQNPLQTVHQFGLGVVLALVMVLSRSIWACVLLHFFNNFISITLTAYLPQIDAIYVQLGYYNWLVGALSVVIGLVLLVCLLYLFYRLGNKKEDGFRVVGGLEYDEFTIYATLDDQSKKSNVIKDTFSFLKSLFTKRGWQMLSRTLTRCNGVEIVGKAQNMSGVWLAIALAVVYWIIYFIMGLV